VGNQSIDISTFGGKLTALGKSNAALIGGAALALDGLTGSRRGTWAGIAEGTAGGALIGYKFGGPLGAAIGGAIGFGIGLGQKLAGVESDESHASNLIKQYYGIDIPKNSDTIKQIVAMAKQSFGGAISVAVRSPQVRELIQLYADSTGQKSDALVALQVHSASLAQSGGSPYQEATYRNGTPYTYASGLPTLGPSGSILPTASTGVPGPMYLSVNLDGKTAADFMTGQYVTPGYVQSQFASAQQASNGRASNASALLQPGLVTR
jgi:hypothetical protein